MTLPIDDVLDRFENVTDLSDGWTARCPAHDDNENSLSISEGDDGRILLRCHAGCEFDDVLRRAGLTHADVRGNGTGRSTSDTDTQDNAKTDGLTLEAYAKAKVLPVDKLVKLGLSEWNGSVRIPYFDRHGLEAAVRYRQALSGSDKFRWKKGSKPFLYGAWLIDQYVKSGPGWVVLVEGESDAHTLIHHNVPVLALPGAANWKEERDADLLSAFTKIYVVIEPDRGGEAVKKWVAKSSIRDRVRFVTLGEHKDVSDLHLADVISGDSRFRGKFNDFLGASIPFDKVEEADAKARAEEAWKTCEPLAMKPDILAAFTDDLRRSGVAGEENAAKLLYLTIVSRLLDEPVSAVPKGPSSAGKSNLVKKTTAFFPDDAYYALSSMSERALIYSKEPLKHRTFILYEAAGVAGDFADYLIRTLLSEGHVRYETVMKTANGLEAVLIEREGPTNLIVTTTASSLHPENETRMLSIPVTDSPEQTRLVLRAIADEEIRAPIDFAPWHAVQVWLSGCDNRVTVPYSGTLAHLVKPVSVRLRRDFKSVLSLVRTHAMLHQATRDRDEQGRIVATPEDYAAIHALVAGIIEDGAEATVPATVRETVKAVDALLNEGSSTFVATVSASQVAEKLGLDKSSASRRVRVAIEREYLRNDEIGRGKPLKLRLGNPLPDGLAILPTPETLRAAVAGAELPVDPEPAPPEDPATEPEPKPTHRPNPFGDRYARNPHRKAS